MARPWKQNAKKVDPPPPKETSLIPTSLIDVPKQRLIITAVFLALQAAKITSNRNSLNLTIFTILDLCFILILPVLSIKWLTFNKLGIFLQIMASMVINYSWFISIAPLVFLLWLTIQPVVFLARQIGILPKYDPYHGLITGKYVVDVLPEAYTELNAIQPICIEPHELVYLQLHLNNTFPSSVTLGVGSLGNLSDYNQLTFSKRDIAKCPIDSVNGDLYLPVKSSGVYFLDRMTDKNSGMRVKIHRHPVVVPNCPKVEIRRLPEHPVCENTEVQANIRVTGLGPLELNVDNKRLSLGESKNEFGLSTVDHVVQKLAKLDGTAVELQSIVDSLGNSKILNIKSGFDVIQPLRATLFNENVPLVSESTDIAVNLEGKDGPFYLTLQGPDRNEFEVVLKTSGKSKIAVTSPGEYKLLNARGSQCHGIAEGKTNVFVPEQVSLQLKFETVEDKCAGPKGLDAKMWFKGTSPFTVGYSQSLNGRVISKKETSFNDKNGILRFRPNEPGLYVYSLLYVEDKYRRTELAAPAATPAPTGAKQHDAAQQYSATQEIETLPGARFVPLRETKICEDKTTPVSVIVTGKGTYTLRYAIDDLKPVQIQSTISNRKIDLQLDLNSGDHYVTLISLTDENGCITDLMNQRTPLITVRKEIPHISFKSSGEFKSVEPVRQSLQLDAPRLQYPAKLIYEHSYKGKSHFDTVKLNSSKDPIMATEPGVYKLVSLDDGVCGGAVSEDHVVISLYERPKLELVGQIEGVCYKQNPNKVEIKMIGEKPFTIVHELVDPKGRSHVNTMQERSQSHVFLDLANDLVGEYEHYLWVMDSRYPEINRKEYNLHFKHKVWTVPNAQFSEQYKLTNCEGCNLTTPMFVHMVGDGPQILEYKLDKEVKTMPLTLAKSNMSPLIPQLSPGQHKISLLTLTDTHGCTQQLKKSEAFVDVKKGPVFPPLQQTDYCLGDNVVLNVGGTSKSLVDLDYLFNNRKHTVKQISRFERYVNTPGSMNIVSIRNADGCNTLVNFNITVHPLPRSTITEKPHFSIYEGEQIKLGFAFDGTPPFSFVMGRFVDDKLVETTVVDDVMSNEHDIIVNEGGVYKILELNDRFCRSQRT